MSHTQYSFNVRHLMHVGRPYSVEESKTKYLQTTNDWSCTFQS